MPNLFPQNWSASERQYLYNIASALAPLMVAYGLASETQISLWLGVVGAVLGFAGNFAASRALHGQRESGLIE